MAFLKPVSICLLQETHSKPEFESLWKRDRIVNIIFSLAVEVLAM